MNTHTRPIMRHDLKASRSNPQVIPSRFQDIRLAATSKIPVSAALNSRRKFGSVPSIRHHTLFKIFSADRVPARKFPYSNHFKMILNGCVVWHRCLR
jgi:hypothetical protein